MYGKTCCFTGHRPESFSFFYNEEHPDCVNLKKKLKDEIKKMITEFKVDSFFCGMAQGTDMWAAEIVLAFKKDYPHISLTAVVPFLGQSRSWNYEQKKRYQTILSLCDKKILISHHYTPYCMIQRNRHMVDISDYVLAVWNGSLTGGTAKTIQYAKSENKEIFIINPSCL